MKKCIVVVTVILLFNHEISASEMKTRQKRCIVIQKQSGGRPDTGEGDEDYDYKKPEPKTPVPDRLRNAKTEGLLRKDVEAFSPEFLDYKKPPNVAMFRRLTNKIRNFFQ